MRRIGGLVVILLMASCACVRCVVIISIVAGHTLVSNNSVGTVERVIFIVNRKGSRIPIWYRGMTGSTISWNTYRQVIGVYTFIEGSGMAF